MPEILASTIEVGECIEWTGRYKDGRPMIVVYKDMGRGHFAVAKMVWSLYNGAAPDGSTFFRTCANPRCVNRRHIELGDIGRIAALRGSLGLAGSSQLTNAKIAATKRARSKYTEEQIEKVRELLTRGMRHTDIESETGVTCGMVSAINRGVTRRIVGANAPQGLANTVFSWRP